MFTDRVLSPILRAIDAYKAAREDAGYFHDATLYMRIAENPDKSDEFKILRISVSPVKGVQGDEL